METQTQSRPSTSQWTFAPGDVVIYPMHGKCTIVAVEDRQVSGQAVSFYKLEIQRSSFSRSSRQEPAIWVPVSSARERGIRPSISAGADVQSVFDVLMSREYYFDAHLNWSLVLPKLEATIRLEGAIGLAKVMSYLHVLKKRQVVASGEVSRMMETVQKLLFREISEVTGETMKDLESKATKAMRLKNLLDN